MKFTDWQRLRLKGNVPSPPEERDGEASTKPQRIRAPGFVAAARFLGGHFFAVSGIQPDEPPHDGAFLLSSLLQQFLIAP